MTPERWQQIRAVFDAALEQPTGSIDEYLRQACGSDAEMYDCVRQMLDEHTKTGLLDRKILNPSQADSGTAVFRENQTVAGRYRIVRYVSRGGMGEVYEARDLELKETVALKTLLPSVAGDESMIARFKQEIALSRKIGHPNVCRVFDLNTDQESGIIFLTMEFLDGETLSARLERDGPMKPADALPILHQIGEALEAAHDAGVIHRDLKPSNVMLVKTTAGVRAVVTDFGLARPFVAGSGSTTTISNALVGTLDYMAPELLTGSSPSFASDVYALGMVAYKMTTGTIPFASDTPLAGAIIRTRQPVPSPRASTPALDEKWERAILRALDATPSKRFTHPRHFLEALRGETVSMTVKLPVLTRRRLVGAVLCAAVVLAGVIAWRQWDQARSRPAPEALALYQKGVADIQVGANYAATKALSQATKVAPRFGLAHARLAEAWFELDLPEQASEEMVVALRQGGSGLTNLDRMQVDAISLKITREFQAAAARYEQIVASAGAQAGELYVDLGRVYERVPDRAKALENYRKAAEGSAQNPAAWLRLAVIYARSGDWTNSDQAFERAEKLYQLSSSMEGLTEVAYQRGVIASRRPAFDQASTYLRNAMETAKLAGNVYQETQAKLQLATVAYNSGDEATAEQYGREALEVARTNQFQQLLIIGLLTLGNAHMLKGDFAAAEKFEQDALAVARQNSLYRLIANCFFSLAALHDQEHRPDQVAAEAQEALSYFQRNGFIQESLQMLTALGRSQRDRGDYAAALTTFHNLLEAADKAHDRAQQAVAFEGSGSILMAQEQFPRAREEYKKDIDIAPPGRLSGYARLWYGAVEAQLNRPKEALAAWKAADPDAEKLPPLRRALVEQRARLALMTGDYAGTIVLSRGILQGDQALDVRSFAVFSWILGLAELRTGKKQDGFRDCEQSLKRLSSAADQTTLLQARLALLEARVANASVDGSREVFQLMEQALANHPESRWRALALLARVDRAKEPEARRAWNDLENQWDRDSFQSYRKRPDVEQLARPLFAAVSAQ